MPLFQYTSGMVLGPPAPFLAASVQHFSGGESYLLKALLDTGADQCYVPRSIVEDGKWGPAMSVPVATPVGRSVRLAYAANLALLSERWPVLLIEHNEEYAIIGRNVLNRFVIRLDGPGLQFEIS